MRLVMAVLCVAGVLIGVAGGYTLWGREAVDVAALSSELEKTRSWLLDEIAWSDERCNDLQAALAKAQAELAQARRELARNRAIVEQTVGDVKPDRPDARDASETTRHTSTR